MAFNSILFVFFFAPAVILLNKFLPTRLSNILLLVVSMAFYAWGEPVFVLVIFASALVDHGLALAIARAPDPFKRKMLLALGVLGNLGLLFYCKYAGFFIKSLAGAIGAIGIPYPEIILPLGISFVVFEKITYLVDVHRGTTAPARSLFDYLLFVYFFPKMLAGPIIKFHEIRDQIEIRSITIADLDAGLTRFLIGLAKKVLIADQLAVAVDLIFAAPSGQIGFAEAWLGAICFSVQIYFDFSGYSDMAIGLARMLGIRLPENFRQPYLSVGFGEFWRRWHISLSSWIRDYLYVPLGGNRVGAVRLYVNLWICFLASGLWHGANWTFVAWGAFHGLFVTIDHKWGEAYRRHTPAVIGIAVTFLLVTLGWVLFRANTFTQAYDLIAAMFSPEKQTTARTIWVYKETYFPLAAGLVLCFIPLQPVQNLWLRLPAIRIVAERLVVLALAIWCCGRLFTVTFSPFLYFRF